MIKQIIVIGFCLSHILAEVLMGFEAELPGLHFNHECLSTDPIIDTGEWKLFTDIGGDDRYMPEIATKYGYGQDKIRQIISEVKVEVTKILDVIKSNSETLLNTPAFRNVLEGRRSKLSDMLSCIDDINHNEKALRILSNEFNEIFNCAYGKLSIENFDQIHKDRKLSLVKIYIEREVAEHIRDFKKEYGYYKKYPSHTNSSTGKKGAVKKFKKNFKKFVDKKFARLTQKIWKSALLNNFDKKQLTKHTLGEDAKIKFIADTQETFQDDNTKDIIDFFIKRPENISTIIKTRKDPPKIMKQFQVHCRMEVETVADEYKLTSCTPNDVNPSIQLTYQFPLSSFTGLLKYYADFIVISPDKSLEALSRAQIPIELAIASDCVLNCKNCDYYSGRFANDKFVQLWNTNKLLAISQILEDRYKDNKNRYAEGLFNWFLLYAQELFNRSDNPAIAESQKNKLYYGPKKALNIMNRISFSEIFDQFAKLGKTKEGEEIGKMEQSIFIELIEELCETKITPQTENGEEMIVDDHRSLCQEMELVEYKAFENYYYAVTIDKWESLTLLEWARSIVNEGERHAKDQLKIVSSSTKSKLSKTKKISSDKLSPPIYYTRFINELTMHKDYEEVAKYGSKAIYSMGAYTGAPPGHAIGEIRTTTSIKNTLHNFHSLIQGHGFVIFDVLSRNEAPEDSGSTNGSISPSVDQDMDVSSADFLLI